MIEYRTLFDSFNARNLSLEEVAETFVENEHFEKLLINAHSLIMGPRGCGKTTLLKMLTPKALRTYDKKMNSNIFLSIPFFSIYIPTDIQWKEQIESFERQYKDYPKLIKFIPKGLVNINVYNSLLETFVQIVETIPLNSKDVLLNLESILCKDLIHIFELEDCASPTFYAIEASILNRISKINTLVNQTGVIFKSENEIQIPNYCFENFLDKVREACFAFERVFSQYLVSFKKPYKWALCFDELEIAPTWLQKELFKFFRSKPQNFLFKLTSTPTINLEEIDESSAATTIDDYMPIRIWVSNKVEFSNWQSFCEKLVVEKIKRRYNTDIKVLELFGEFSYEKALVSESKYPKRYLEFKDYEADSIYLNEIKELYGKDMSFQKYLDDKKISIDNLCNILPKEKDEIFRKVKPYVVYRNYFVKSFTETKARFRTRNIQNPFYFGWTDICNVSDGNPRTIIGLTSLMIPNIEFDNKGKIKMIPYKKQAQIIYQISKKYMDVWSTNPKSNLLIYNQIYSLRKTLSSIGEYFQYEILKYKFTPSPVGTFAVDDNVKSKILDLVNLSLFLGAIVYLNPSENDRLAKNLINKRFRLSFLLYPYFKIPNRLEGEQTILSSILNSNQSDLGQAKELF